MNSESKKSNKTPFVVAFITGVIVFLLIYGVFNMESTKRFFKSVSSDIGGGLERTVTVYDYNGDILKTYQGKFDVNSSEYETYFDLNDKRIIIHGGIVINEEQ